MHTAHYILHTANSIRQQTAAAWRITVGQKLSTPAHSTYSAHCKHCLSFKLFNLHIALLCIAHCKQWLWSSHCICNVQYTQCWGIWIGQKLSALAHSIFCIALHTALHCTLLCTAQHTAYVALFCIAQCKHCISCTLHSECEVHTAQNTLYRVLRNMSWSEALRPCPGHQDPSSL